MKTSDDEAKEYSRTLSGQEFGCQNGKRMGVEDEGIGIKAPSQTISTVSPIQASGNYQPPGSKCPFHPARDVLAA